MGRIKRNRTDGVDSEYLNLVRDYKQSENKRIKSEQADLQVASPPELPVDLTTPEPELPPAPEYPELSDIDSDDFEDVDINIDPQDSVSVTVSGPQPRTNKSRPKSDPKSYRLLMHKLALVSWTMHGFLRNKWLESPDILQSSRLRETLPEPVTSLIFPPEHLTPFLKSKKLVEGLRLAAKFWQDMFNVTKPSICSTKSGSKGDFGDKDEFINQVLSFEGSVDLLGQSFVALMRANGFKTRLIVSLQPPDNLTTNTIQRINKSSNCPIYWSEVWDPYTKGWISVDPLTLAVRLPTKARTKCAVEPPQTDPVNLLRYCFAFDENMRDVTRRYAYQYNARTRKKRLPHFESEKWLLKFTSIYSPRKFTSEDKEELRELYKYPLLEGIPSSVQDFVGHPKYALAQQLRRNEVLRPQAKMCGTLATKSKGTIYIYNRSDVLTCRSAQSWHRKARIIKLGAQPRTQTTLRNRLTREMDRIGLYTLDQTEKFVPEPVINGEVPKSKYRTIDLFCAQMLPLGAAHITHPNAQRACKILRIDYANAVTGVDFGRSGPKSRVNGVVIAREFSEGVHCVLRGLVELDTEMQELQERMRLLRLWKRLVVGIQIWNRVEQMNPDLANSSGGESSASDDSFNDLDVEDIDL